MNSSAFITVKVTHEYSQPPEAVFDAWLDEKTTGKWLFATDDGEMVRVEIDGQTGGSFIFVDRRNGEDIEHVGQYILVDRPRRLIFAFKVPKFSADLTEVNVEIVHLDNGCQLSLVHENVIPEYAEKTAAGWEMILSNLEKQLHQPVV